MKMPVYTKKNRVKHKICQEPGCAKEFWGHPIAKYCELHRDIKLRVKPEKIVIQANEVNLEINHENKEPKEEQVVCSLDGCNALYNIMLFPKQTIYPKFCPEHRNEFKRSTFMKNMTKVS